MFKMKVLIAFVFMYTIAIQAQDEAPEDLFLADAIVVEDEEFEGFNDSESVVLNEEAGATLTLMNQGIRLSAEKNNYHIFFHGGYINLSTLQALEGRYWGDDIVALKGYYPEGSVTFRTKGGDLDKEDGGKIRVAYASKDEFEFSVEGTIVNKQNQRLSVMAQNVVVKINKIIDKRSREMKIEALQAQKEITSSLAQGE